MTARAATAGFLRRIRAMIVKEFIQLRRDRVTFATMIMIPLLQLVNTWATRRGVTYEPRMDERTTAMGVKPAN